ncbi:MAG: ethanolamine utilization cob(I)yrinic acid a,c-diamide adenosyltransferase EutT [Candidatus Accumulibacter sp.]|jgi:ethanolamine utilization cobalamin adenosyltransferase|nr:ethanolamine utilization cob(I)yrinic acid a,c-diamide adenosyltransferase EutT [Accumulibacter sp.]
MSTFVTESWLRERFSLAHGSEIHLPENGRLTPSARTLLEERRIHVKYLDDAGRAFVETKAAQTGHGEEPALRRVPVLTGKNERNAATCLLCAQPVSAKPDTLTSLDGKALVAKNDPRLKLRGKLDTAIAHAVWIQAEFDPESGKTPLAHWLADVRSALGRVLKAEVTGEAMPPVVMGEFDEAAIHAISHNPLKYIGHDHIVPEVDHGVRVARLNLLRAQIREAELFAADVFIDRDFKVVRPDIMQALNRLSSAVYVLMLMTLMAERHQPVAPKKERSWN